MTQETLEPTPALLPCRCGNAGVHFRREVMSCATQVICDQCGRVGARGAYEVGAIAMWNADLSASPPTGTEDADDPIRMAYKTGYNEGYIDATDDGTGNGYTDRDACEEGWQQYRGKISGACGDGGFETAWREMSGHLDALREPGKLPAKYLGLNIADAAVRRIAELEAALTPPPKATDKDVERVAHALQQQDRDLGQHLVGWDCIGPQQQSHYFFRARAAIATLQEGQE